MKINAVETILLQIPYDIGAGPMAIAGRPASGLNILLIRIDIDDELTGWGEAFGHAVTPATKVVIDTMMAPMLIGRDSSNIGGLMREVSQTLHLFGHNGPVIYGLSGIDIALWDIAGKRAALRSAAAPDDRRRCGQDGSRLYQLAALRGAAVAAGERAQGRRRRDRFIKLHEIDPDLVALARAAIGPDIALMVDTNCPWTRGQAA